MRNALAVTLILFVAGACDRTNPDVEPTPVADSKPRENVTSDSAETEPPAVILSDRTAKQRNALIALAEPGGDDWQSEEISKQLKSAFDMLLKEASDPQARSQMSARVAPDRRWITRPWRVPSRGKLVTVERTVEEGSPEENGVDLGQGFGRLLSGFQNDPPPRMKSKLYGLDTAGDGLETRIRVELFGPLSDNKSRSQLVADLACRWQFTDDQPVLIEVREQRIESVTATAEWFVDQTEAVLGSEGSYQQQLRLGMNHWVRRIEERHGLHDSGRNGIAVGDVNGDGFDDVYVCQTGGLPNRLFLQNKNGTATDASGDWGVDVLDETSSALLVDLDNDADQDLVLAITGHLVVFENQENSRLELVRRLPLADEDVKSLSAADFDNDADLDIYICVDMALSQARPTETPPPFAYHDANEGGANVLFANQHSQGGSFDFADVTVEAGLDVHNRRHSLAAAWEDFDNDGDLDLYVANDYGQNCLYRNEAGRFTDVAQTLGVLDAASGMSVSWGDYDLDGRMDLYVANMWSAAGGRISTQANFQAAADLPTRAAYRRFAKGNTLFRNDGVGFVDTGKAAGVEMGRWAWSSLFADLDNDAWPDLVVANGYLTTDDSGDL